MTAQAPYLAVFLYAAGEPIEQRIEIERIAKDVLDALAVPSARVFSATVKGEVGSSRALSWNAFDSLLSPPDVGSITIRGATKLTRSVKLKFYLRHNPSVQLKYQPPGVLYFTAECGGNVSTATCSHVANTALQFVKNCASAVPLLHGGITLLPNEDQAVSEASLVGMDLSRQPQAYVRRWNYDAFNAMRLWERARRVYWLTHLGPYIANAAGGASAARVAGAAEVIEVEGSLLIRATDRIEDTLSEEFPGRIRGLQKWLWPLTIQNPVDAEGIGLD